MFVFDTLHSISAIESYQSVLESHFWPQVQLSVELKIFHVLHLTSKTSRSAHSSRFQSWDEAYLYQSLSAPTWPFFLYTNKKSISSLK
jgi:hypothetical protein